MIAANPRTIVSALIGMLAGYVLWLAGIALITATLPVNFWAVGGALLLAAIIAGAIGAARYQRGFLATALLWAPATPILASVYLLICIIH